MTPKTFLRATLPALAVAGIVALGFVGVYHSVGNDPMLVDLRRQPVGVMGTDSNLIAVVTPTAIDAATEALVRAEQALRLVQIQMDYRAESSDIWRLNNSEPGESVALSPDTMAVLTAARRIYNDSNKAFDITVGGAEDLWRAAVQADSLPSRQSLAAALAGSNWDLLSLYSDSAIRREATVRVDLGGLAKGFGIDRALEVLRQAGCSGALVDVGGDIACFGRAPGDRDKWSIALRDPFAAGSGRPGQLAVISIAQGAICTSGHYMRGYTIAGRRFSHIIDPRPDHGAGWALAPAEAPASVTVFAPKAIDADAWATALSVLGADGLSMLKPEWDIQVLMVYGPSDSRRCIWTPGFADLLDRPLPGSQYAPGAGSELEALATNGVR